MVYVSRLFAGFSTSWSFENANVCSLASLSLLLLLPHRPLGPRHTTCHSTKDKLEGKETHWWIKLVLPVFTFAFFFFLRMYFNAVTFCVLCIFFSFRQFSPRQKMGPDFAAHSELLAGWLLFPFLSLCFVNNWPRCKRPSLITVIVIVFWRQNYSLKRLPEIAAAAIMVIIIITCPFFPSFQVCMGEK